MYRSFTLFFYFVRFYYYCWYYYHEKRLQTEIGDEIDCNHSAANYLLFNTVEFANS